MKRALVEGCERTKVFCTFALMLLISQLAGCGFADSDSGGRASYLAENGEIDLRGWKGYLDHVIDLDGMWEFDWARLRTPASSSAVDTIPGFLEVPGFWTGQKLGGAELPGTGHGTYRLKLLAPPGLSNPAIKINRIQTAWAMWANGVPLAGNGTVGVSRATSRPQENPQIVALPVDAGVIELVIQVSNYHHRNGGFHTSVQFGDLQVLQEQRTNQLVMDGFLVGGLLIVALYHLGLFVLRKQDYSVLWFACFCLALAFRPWLTGEHYLSFRLPELSWEFLTAFEYLTIYLALPFSALFIRSLFPEQISRRLVQVLTAISAALVLAVIGFPASTFTHTLGVFQFVTVMWLLYSTIMILVAAHRHREGAKGVALGYLILFAAVINDILRADGLIDSDPLIPVAVYLLVFAQIFIISLKYAKAFRRIERLSLTFKKFVPRQFLDRLAKTSIERIQLGSAESCEVTILFSDIRAFTSLSETLSPQGLLNFLNEYFDKMNAQIHSHSGFIDKFIGDAVMALFDSPPNRQGEDVECAIRAAIGMLTALKSYNLSRHDQPPVQIGIGLHRGPVIIGTVGSLDRMDSTVLGDSVNLASRLEGLTKHYGVRIIVSTEALQLVDCHEKKFDSRPLDRVMVKGKSNPVGIHEIFSADDEPLRLLKKRSSPLIAAGLLHRSRREWAQSAERFADVLRLIPGDRAAEALLASLHDLEAAPPPEGWSGAISINQK